jgi:uncharacterized membrane-anchored protein YitT (DUF2179 family)
LHSGAGGGVVEVAIWVEDLLQRNIGGAHLGVDGCFLLRVTFAVVLFTSAAWAGAEEVLGWALCVSTVVAFFVAVEAFEVVAVADTSNLMLPGALLAVVV